MPLPADFQFSQTNLQDYADCPRRFELRHIQRLHYPSIESEPQAEREAHARRGTAFHRLVHQYYSGVSAEVIGNQRMDDALRRWWNAFRHATFPFHPPKAHYAEITLSAPLAGYRLLAKYDLIAQTEDNHFWVMDWKTQPAPPPTSNLLGRWQTVVYPYVLACAGKSLTDDGADIPPEHIHMGYWFAETGTLVAFDYDASQRAQAETHLTALIDGIKARDDFPLTDALRHCQFCTYRSLCNRGNAGEMPPDYELVVDIDEHFDLDWDAL